MTRLTSTLAVLASLAGAANAFLGYGIAPLMSPPCAMSCRQRISGSELDCSIRDGEAHTAWHGHGDAAAFHTEEDCYASDENYLTTIALCIHVKCGSDLKSWEKEEFWATTVVDARGTGRVEPKWMYGQALAVAMERVEEYGGLENVPVMAMGLPLNQTSVVEPFFYAATLETLINYSWNGVYHARYGLILLLASAAFPILLTWGHVLPFYTRIADALSPYLDMSIFKGYYVRTLPYWLGNATTLGQTLSILAFVGLNIGAAAADIKSIENHTMFRSKYVNMLVNLGGRTGVLCFALSPLVLLLAARNNLLMWVTDWPHGTFMMMHRWVARMWVFQAVMHSIVELVLYKYQGTYDKESAEPAWIWGAAATMASIVLIATAVTWMRRNHYETFLLLHIILALVIFIGSYYHVWLYYEGARGLEYWLYACFAVWGGDRVWRIWHVVKTGSQRSTVREIGDAIVRVDIPGVRWAHTPGAHGYVYFPTLSWRPWENHPFSVTPTALIERAKQRRSKKSAVSSSTASLSGAAADEEKAVNVGVTDLSAQETARTSTGMTLFVKKGKSLTGRLTQATNLLTWLEGPYHDRSTERVSTADRLVCIAGGVGITGVLTFAAAHANAKLYWSMKESDAALARELEDVTEGVIDESEVRTGERFDLRAVVEAEMAKLEAKAADGNRKELGVVVCGPPALCDEVRAVVTRLGRKNSGSVVVVMAVEAFAW